MVFGWLTAGWISRRRSESMVEKLRFSILICILLRGGRTRTLVPSPCQSRHRGNAPGPKQGTRLQRAAVSTANVSLHSGHRIARINFSLRRGVGFKFQLSAARLCLSRKLSVPPDKVGSLRSQLHGYARSPRRRRVSKGTESQWLR